MEVPYNSEEYRLLDYETFIHKICVQGARPALSASIPQILKSLIHRSWDRDPQQRPTAKEMYEVIQDHLSFCERVEGGEILNGVSSSSSCHLPRISEGDEEEEDREFKEERPLLLNTGGSARVPSSGGGGSMSTSATPTMKKHPRVHFEEGEEEGKRTCSL